jgi:hypothetical protein
MRPLVTTDGEAIQIQTFMEPDCALGLKVAAILEGKHSASYSAKGNAWDGEIISRPRKRELSICTLKL